MKESLYHLPQHIRAAVQHLMDNDDFRELSRLVGTGTLVIAERYIHHIGYSGSDRSRRWSMSRAIKALGLWSHHVQIRLVMGESEWNGHRIGPALPDDRADKKGSFGKSTSHIMRPEDMLAVIAHSQRTTASSSPAFIHGMVGTSIAFKRQLDDLAEDEPLAEPIATEEEAPEAKKKKKARKMKRAATPAVEHEPVAEPIATEEEAPCKKKKKARKMKLTAITAVEDEPAAEPIATEEKAPEAKKKARKMKRAATPAVEHEPVAEPIATQEKAPEAPCQKSEKSQRAAAAAVEQELGVNFEPISASTPMTMDAERRHAEDTAAAAAIEAITIDDALDAMMTPGLVDQLEDILGAQGVDLTPYTLPPDDTFHSIDFEFASSLIEGDEANKTQQIYI